MAQYMNKIREMLETELGKIAEKGKLSSTSDVQLVDQLTHAVKSIACIQEMEESGYSERGSRGYSGHGSERNYENGYNDGYSEAMERERSIRRSEMRRYLPDDGYSRDSRYRDGGYSEREYSRDGGSRRMGSYTDGKEDVMRKMREMMEQAPNDQEREKIRRMMEQMQN